MKLIITITPTEGKKEKIVKNNKIIIIIILLQHFHHRINVAVVTLLTLQYFLPTGFVLVG